MSSSYEIFPNTSATGSISKASSEKLLPSECERYCNSLDSCQGYVVDEDSRECVILDNFYSFENSPKNTTYVKRKNSNYHLITIIVIGVLIVLFVNRCRNV